MSARHERIKALFAAVCGLDEAARRARLDRECGDDHELRHEVERLLAHDDRPAVDLEDAAGRIGRMLQEASSAPAAPAVERIGDYRIVEVLGEGGMGIVYLAEQDNPKRTVALKVVRPGHATPELIRRFERETQVLGLLQHPGIAQIYEAGTAETGFGTQPYFAMEYVRGMPLLEHAESHELDHRSRIGLLIRICHAVQHAHQHGVVHRDLKPSNIIVNEATTHIGTTATESTLDAEQPKVLDFGIARLTASDDRMVTMQTDAQQLIGTLPYMSPEQFAGTSLEVDARSDVYALGVVAFELLTGQLPLDVRAKTIAEAARMVADVDAPRLGTLDRAYRGDLETIVAKTLEKSRGRRYQSAADLALDLQRYLDDQPIVARRASTWYQVSKFTKRNRGLVAGLAAVFVALVGGVIGTGLGLVEARRQRDEAVRQTLVAEAVNDFLTDDLLEQADPSQQLGASVTLRAVLDRAAERIDERFEGQPIVKAAIHTAIGVTYRELGLYGDAIPHLEAALELRTAALGPDDPETLHALNNLGSTHGMNREYEVARPMLEDALARRLRVLGDDDVATGTSMNDLAVVLISMQEFDEAEALLTEAIENRRRSGAGSRRLLSAQFNLARIKRSRGAFDEAERLVSACIEQQRIEYGPEHPDTLNSIFALALIHRDRQRPEQAEPLLLEALQTQRRTLGDEDMRTRATIQALGELYLRADRLAEAEPLIMEYTEFVLQNPASSDRDRLGAMNDRAFLWLAQDRFEEAEQVYLGLIDEHRRAFGPDAIGSAEALLNLGGLYARLERHDDAAARFAEALEVLHRVLGPEHPRTLLTLNNLAGSLDEAGRNDEAAERFAQSVALHRQAMPQGFFGTGITMSGYGQCLTRLGRFEEAESILLEAHAILLAAVGAEHDWTRNAAARLADLYDAWGRPEDGAGWRPVAGDEPER